MLEINGSWLCEHCHNNHPSTKGWTVFYYILFYFSIMINVFNKSENKTWIKKHMRREKHI